MYYGLIAAARSFAPSLSLSLSLLGLSSGSGSVNPAHVHTECVCWDPPLILFPLVAFPPSPHASLASLASHLPPTLPSLLSIHPLSSLRPPHAPRDLLCGPPKRALRTSEQPLQAGEPGPVQLPEGGRRGRELRHSNVRYVKIHLRAPIVSHIYICSSLTLLFEINRSDHDIRRAPPSTPQRPCSVLRDTTGLPRPAEELARS